MPRSPRTEPRRRLLGPLAAFLRTEAGAGVVLLGATVAVLIWANVAPESYATTWGTQLTLGVGRLDRGDTVQHWINDGLMALFFFVVGLEIKRELVVGELRDRRVAALPAIAALGGMIVPALIYLAWNAGTPAARGWGIPIATDIAFAVGVLALLGSRVPSPLRLFLLTLAIVDDIGAIVVIALFYREALHWFWLLGAAISVLAVLGLRNMGVRSPVIYVLPGLVCWFCVLESGVHATIAGVLLALCTPARGRHGASSIERVERLLHPVTAFVVIPLFALANAGLVLGRDELRAAANSAVTWGVATGLVAGKAIGVAGATFFAVRLGIGRLPRGITPRQIVGMAFVAGIGFTVSLFVSDLAFRGTGNLSEAKIGVFVASCASGLIGSAMLYRRRA